MKKNFLALLGVAILFVVSCNKEKDPQIPTTPNNPNNPGNPVTATSFIINGVSDVNMQDSFAAQAIAVTYTTGAQEKVTLSLSGLPNGIKANIDPASGTPTFSSLITYTASSAVLGTYPLTLKGTTASGTVKEYTFNLIYADCITPLIGSYYATNKCGSDSYNYKTTITKGVSGKVIISNFMNQNYTLNAEINCGSKTFTIPSQQLGYSGSVTISGTGTINSDSSITINYTAQYPGNVTTNCSVTLVDESKVPQCADALTGSYTMTNSCSSSSNSQFVYANPTIPNEITFGNFMSTGIDLDATVNCTAKTITIASQSDRGFTISGSGTFTQNSMTLNFTFNAGGSTQNCTAQLTK